MTTWQTQIGKWLFVKNISWLDDNL